jgi:hypothetical protein
MLLHRYLTVPATARWQKKKKPARPQHYICFVDRFMYFFFWPLCCLFFDMRVLIGPLISSNSSSVYDRTVSCGVRQEDMKSHETLSVVVLRVSFIFASGLLLVLLNIDAIAQFPGRKRKQLLDVDQHFNFILEHFGHAGGKYRQDKLIPILKENNISPESAKSHNSA